MKKKMNWLSLSGFMIGPILGSGIILLPPLIFNKIGGVAIYSWFIMLLLGVFFALIFAKLATMYPGDGGMTIAVEHSFGVTGKLMSSYTLISAVLFGPAAVLLTASEYLSLTPIMSDIRTEVIAIFLVLLGFILLQNQVHLISKLILLVSSAITSVLIVSSIYTLFNNPPQISPLSQIEPTLFGQSLLLIFWAIIGWEIIGNYSEEVAPQKNTILTATLFSLAVITITYLTVALAVQSIGIENVSLIDILYPLLGSSSKWILAILFTGLCFGTYLTIVGAVGRLIHSLAESNDFPQLFRSKNQQDIPVNALALLTFIHLCVLILALYKIINIEFLVTIANGFFIANAIIGLASSLKLIDHWSYKISALILIAAFGVLIIFLNPICYAIYGVISLVAVIRSKRHSLIDSRSTPQGFFRKDTI